MAKCNKCNREWISQTEAHCVGCCEHFSRVSVFDRHRVGKDEKRRCATDKEMIASKLIYDEERKLWRGESFDFSNVEFKRTT